MEKNEQMERRVQNKVWNTIHALILAILIPFCGWVSLEIIDINRWIAKTDGNRFTSNDWALERLRIDEKFRIEVPPKWFEEAFEDLKKKVELIPKEIQELRIELKTHSHRHKGGDS